MLQSLQENAKFESAEQSFKDVIFKIDTFGRLSKVGSMCLDFCRPCLIYFDR